MPCNVARCGVSGNGHYVPLLSHSDNLCAKVALLQKPQEMRIQHLSAPCVCVCVCVQSISLSDESSSASRGIAPHSTDVASVGEGKEGVLPTPYMDVLESPHHHQHPTHLWQGKPFLFTSRSVHSTGKLAGADWETDENKEGGSLLVSVIATARWVPFTPASFSFLTRTREWRCAHMEACSRQVLPVQRDSICPYLHMRDTRMSFAYCSVR